MVLLRYQAKQQDQKDCEAFEVRLELEGRAAVKHRQCMVVAGYRTTRGARVYSVQKRMKGISMEGSDSRAPRRDRQGA